MSRDFRKGRARPARKRVSPARRLLDLALALAILGLVAIVAARWPSTGPARTIEGPARIGDGDSLVIGAERIRLEGIDAPELPQTCSRDGGDYACGREARDALARLAAGRLVTCEGSGRDRYDRLLARCSAGGRDLNRAMVEAGWAVAYGGYEDAEDAARRSGRGLWAGSFDLPQDWRRIHGGLAEEAHGGWPSLLGWLRSLLGN